MIDMVREISNPLVSLADSKHLGRIYMGGLWGERGGHLSLT